MARAVVARDGMWGFDASAITASAVASLVGKNYVTPDGVEHPLEFAYIYVPFAGQHGGGATLDTFKALLDIGKYVGLVQHVRSGLWKLDPLRGEDDGKAAADYAMDVLGYPAGCHVGMDLEMVLNRGQQVADGVTAWAGGAMDVGGYPQLLYVGYRCGLTPDALWRLPFTHLYWSDFGHRIVPHRGCSVQQLTNTVHIPGVPFGLDIDCISKDLLGGLPTLAAA